MKYCEKCNLLLSEEYCSVCGNKKLEKLQEVTFVS